jgi:hypothetical protein
MNICSYGRRSDGLSMCFNSDMVSDDAVFMFAIQDVLGIGWLRFIVFEVSCVLWKS